MGFNDLDIESGGDYIKLTGGTTVTFHILTRDPKKQTIHWENQKKSSCTGKVCEMCAKGNRPKARWTVEAWDRKDGTLKKLEFGNMIATQLKAIAEMLAENNQTIHDVDIRVKTTGSSLETEYSVLYVPMSGSIPQEVVDKYIPF